MANQHKGEVAFELDGRTWVLCFSTNALCELEDALDLGIAEIASLMGDSDRIRLGTARAMFWAGLRDKSPDIEVRVAGDLMTALGMQRAMELVGQAFALAFPQGDRARPRKGRDRTKGGTGPRS